MYNRQVGIDKRDKSIDIVKAICIVLMVMCHAGISLPYSKFIYMFHMPVFFIVSGYVFNSKHSDSFDAFVMFVKRKIKRLWFPFFVSTSVFLVLNNFFIKINVYTNNPLFLKEISGEYNHLTEPLSIGNTVVQIFRALTFNSETQLGGALWFLKVLFFLTVFYAFCDLLIKTILKKANKKGKNTVLLIQGILSIVFLFIGYKFFWYVGVDNYIQLKVASFYSLYYLGIVFRVIRDRIDNINIFIKILIWAISLTVLVILTLNKEIDKFELANNQYNNPLILLLASVSGLFFCFFIAKVILKIEHLSKPTIYLGKNTLYILILHLLCFKIVSYLGVIIYHQPFYLVAAFPVLYEGELWWLAYTIVGVLFPVLFGMIYSIIKRRTVNIFIAFRRRRKKDSSNDIL